MVRGYPRGAILTDGTICWEKSPHQINSLWADFSKRMGTIRLGQTTSGGGC